jgi:maltose alpha-D-glucosyltransferase / alpha-amylase
VIKLYRRLEDGTSLDLELGQFLSEQDFENTPTVLGSLDYRRDSGPSRTLAVAQEFVPNEGDAWSLTLDAISEYYERAASAPEVPLSLDARTRTLLRLAATPAPDEGRALVGSYIEEARLLGQRTADMHVALASAPDNAAFAPEPFTMFYQRSLYQSMRNLAGRVLQLLGSRSADMQGEPQALAQEVLEQNNAILERFRTLIDGKITGARIRCHGDYHLGQVLWTGNDFHITDFEGEPIRPLSERRLKRSPLRDVAGMLRSFHYAAYAAQREHEQRHNVHPRDHHMVGQWARTWYVHAGSAFLNGYMSVMASSEILPASADEMALLLDALLLEKAVYELGYELGNRPDWVEIPLRGVLQLLEHGESSA